MKTINYFLLSLALMLNFQLKSIAQQETPINNSQTVKITDAFDKINVNGSTKLIIKQGTEQGFSVESPNVISDIINFKTKEGTLIIDSEKKSDIIVTLTFTNLSKITTDDKANVSSNEPIKLQNFEITTNDVSTIKLAIDVENLTIKSNDASRVRLSGKALNQTLVVNDAARVKNELLESNNVKAEINDAASAWVNCKENLTGKASGVSKLYYHSSAKNVDVETNDFSRTKKYETVVENSNDEYSDFSNNDSIKQFITDILIQVDSTINIDVPSKPNKWYSKIKMHKNNKFDGNWGGIMIGFNNYTTPSGKMEVPKGYDYLDLNFSKSYTIALNLLEQNFNLIGQKLGITTGLGFQWYRYRFEDNAVLLSNQSYVNGFIDTSSARSYEKSRLSYSMLNIPLILEFQTNPNHGSRSFHINGGVIFGLKLGSHTKTVYDDGAETKTKVYDDFNLNPIRLDATVGIGYGFINLFGSYSLTTLFKDKKGPEMYPATIGIQLINW